MALVMALVVGVAISAGTWLRASEISRKPWWADEVATWLVLSGCSDADVEAAWDGRPHSVDELLNCQRTRPDGDRMAMLRALLHNESQNLPLYFLVSGGISRGPRVAREWGPRVVSALAGILSLLAGACFARELFGSWRAGALVAALSAVSPLHLRYAVEARAYALWSLFTVLGAWLLLRACRTGRTKDWVLFTLTQMALVQTHLLALPVSLGLLGWHWEPGRARGPGWAPAFRRHAAALAVSITLLLPWAAAAILRRDRVGQTLDWTTQPGPLLEMARRWLGILTNIFLRTGADGGLIGAGESGGMLAARTTVGLGIALIIGLSVRRLWRENRRAVRYLLLLTAPLLLMLAGSDILLGGRRSTVARYWVPVWWAAGLVVAGALSSWMGERARRTAAAATTVLGLLAAFGLCSCLRMIPSPVWWDTNDGVWPLLVNEARSSEGPAKRYWIERVPPRDVIAFARLLPPRTELVLGAAPAAELLQRCEALGFLPSSSSSGQRPAVYRCPVETRM